MVYKKKIKRLFFLNKKLEDNTIKKKINNKIISSNLFFIISNYFFKRNLKNKFNINLLNVCSFFLNFLIENRTDLSKNYTYINFFKKNFSLNKWFFNFNNFFKWILLNYKILFFFKKNPNIANKNNFSFSFLLKSKRKKIFFKWIKNRLSFVQKKTFFLKFLNLFLDVILNFKKSNFFKFKNLIYRSILIK